MQPGPVAGTVVHAQGRPQRCDQHHVEQQHPLPPLGQLVDIHQGHQEIGRHTNHRRAALDDHIFPGLHIVSGAGDLHQAEGRRRTAQRQQHQIGLPENIEKQFFRPLQHGPS